MNLTWNFLSWVVFDIFSINLIFFFILLCQCISISSKLHIISMNYWLYNRSGHAGSISYADQCGSIKIRFQEVIPMWLNKDHCWSILINKDQFSSTKINVDQCRSMPIGIDSHWSLLRRIDLYWEELILIDRQWLAMIFIEPHLDQFLKSDLYWSALIGIRDWSGMSW